MDWLNKSFIGWSSPGWRAQAEADLAAARAEVERLSAQADDVLAELDLLDAEFVEFANGSHGHLRVKRALAALRGKDGG
jgi:hypothetical protein